MSWLDDGELEKNFRTRVTLGDLSRWQRQLLFGKQRNGSRLGEGAPVVDVDEQAWASIVSAYAAPAYVGRPALSDKAPGEVMGLDSESLLDERRTEFSKDPGALDDEAGEDS